MAGTGTKPLRLEVREFTDLTRWCWTLTDANGAFLADHEIRLDPSAERFEAFTALWDYVSWHAAPDKRPAEEARIVTGLGDWIGEHIFGTAIGHALVAHRPVTVQVILPAGAEALAYLPLETARIQGRSLVAHDITLVVRPQAASGSHHEAAIGNRLRVLGLFSLPDGGSALNLRRERQSLVELIRGIAASGRAAGIRVLQYGVTRDRLRDILEEAEGWDIIHVSGHGVPGQLVLETAAGTPDPVSAGDLADLLDSARDHVKLVTLSACSSAALTAAEQRRLLGLPVEEDQNHHHPERPGQSPPARSSAPGTLATILADRLGCAVLAMRFPVSDEFAIALSGNLYDLLARQGQPLPRAIAMTLSHLTYRTDRRFPALSMAAPAIFGATAADLTLKAPKRTGPVSYATENRKMAGFPPEPERFVGRTAVMARASAALAADSRMSGVFLHGMPGGGKTACALELAYTHEHAFEQLVWFKAPDEGMAIDGALTDFALTLERDLPGFQMIHVLADDTKLTAFLPQLTKLMEQSRLLIVIDNAESLLTDSGRWRDEQWSQVFGALSGHIGLGRVIVTSRRAPAGTPTLGVEAVDALTADEALLLARELPHLRELIDGELPGIGRDTSRKLARGVLTVAQGHPKLLELADGQAANPEQLAALTEAGNEAWRDQGGLPDGFFSTGETAAAPGDYLHVLAAWTKTVTDTLTPGERDLFWFLCCLEESDRVRPVLLEIWNGLWQRLGRGGRAPALHQTLTVIASRGLSAVKAKTDEVPESYAVHPGLAGAGRDFAGQEFQDAADDETAAYWITVVLRASGQDDNGDVDTGLMVQASLAAVPYLIRIKQWNKAAVLLNNAFSLDPSRANAAAVLPAIHRITRHDDSHMATLAMVLLVLDPAAGETLMRGHLDEAVERGDYQAASAATRLLANLCLDSGRLTEALTLTGRMADYTRRAGLGPWAQLADEGQRLQVLSRMGQSSQVLAEVRRLRARMDTLPIPSSLDEVVDPSNVRETLLHIGCVAAKALGQYDEALDLGTAQITSMRERSAPSTEIARAQANNYGPLLELGRVGEALELLLECRQSFHNAGDIESLGKTLGALAHIEHTRGHSDAAIRFERDALRYEYQAGDVLGVSVSYHNLGGYLHVRASQPDAALAYHLIAALIRSLIGIGGAGPESAAESVRAAAADLHEFGANAEPPADVTDLCRRIGNILGTDPARLMERLAPDSESAERTLRDLIAQARRLAGTLPDDADHE